MSLSLSLLDFAFLAAAGVAGGLTGSIAGLASLATYPALLAVGIPPLTANVTNTVALTFSTVGAVLGSQPELRGQGPRLKALTPAALLGGATGAALLLFTPAAGFERVVPILLGLASLTILIPRRASMSELAVETPPPRNQLLLQMMGIFLIAIYGGYFGAAAGVVLLALLLHTTRASLPRANAAKSVLLGIANLVAAVAFAFLSDVEWSAVLPLGIGCLVGARFGPMVVRRTSPLLLRLLVGAAGMGLAIRLAILAWS